MYSYNNYYFIRDLRSLDIRFEFELDVPIRILFESDVTPHIDVCQIQYCSHLQVLRVGDSPTPFYDDLGIRHSGA